MKRTTRPLLGYIIIGLTWLLTLAGCSRSTSDSDDRPTLAVSVEPMRTMLQEIVGDRYDVVTVMPPGANPETFEPTVSRRVAVDKSAAYFKTGLLPFEERILSSLGNDVKVVDTSTGIDLVHGTHEHAHSHDNEGDSHHHHNHAHNHSDADPHIWTSVKNARIMLATMTDAVCDLDPDNAEYYQKRLAEAHKRLAALDESFARRLADAPSKAFAVWHPSLSYFARDYGLEQIAVGQESKEISPAGLKKISEHAIEEGVRTFFFQKEYDSRQAEAINRQIGSKLVTIDPTAHDWETELSRIVDSISK